ncbi:hypothetical protein NL676_038838 [Syzygium grande]|nr:hypothetical protein NL676_038838 [Syzygium grande]
MLVCGPLPNGFKLTAVLAGMFKSELLSLGMHPSHTDLDWLWMSVVDASMADMYMLFLATLIVLSSSLQSHAVEYTVTNDAGNTTGRRRFSSEIGIPDSRRTLTAATGFIWRVFHQNAPGIVKVSRKGSSRGPVPRDDARVAVERGRRGPGGLIEGIADFVRLRSGYVPGHWVGPGQGDRWDQGYDITARFLDYCNGLRKGFVAELNKKMRTGYSDSYFVDLLERSVDQLWKDYKAKYAT